MATVRRWYVFLVCFISLQAAAWALAALTGDLFRELFRTVAERSVSAIALHVAVTVVGLILFGVHWPWAQRLAAREPAERAALLREVYLYATLATVLGRFAHAGYQLLVFLIWPPSGMPRYFTRPDLVMVIPELLATLLLMGALWLYHARVLAADYRVRQLSDTTGALGMIYRAGFSAAGLVLAVTGGFPLLRWALAPVLGGTAEPFISSGTAAPYTLPLGHVWELALLLTGLPLWWLHHRQIIFLSGRAPAATAGGASLRRVYVYGVTGVALLAAAAGLSTVLRALLMILTNAAPGPDELAGGVAIFGLGLPLWLLYWLIAQRAFAGPDPDERRSALRRLACYVARTAALLGFTATVVPLLAGVLQNALGVPVEGEWQGPLAGSLVALAIWAYYTAVLRSDTAATGDVELQPELRLLYRHGIALVGLAMVLGGLGGAVSALIRALADAVFSESIRGQLAIALAALLAGLPLWLVPWRRLQAVVGSATAEGHAARRSALRKLFLYLFIFAATLTVFAAVVYIVYRFVALLLGERLEVSLLSDLAHAIAFGLIAVGVWIYHGSILRSDGRLLQRDRQSQLAGRRVVVVDGGDGAFGHALLAALEREFPGIVLTPIGLTPEAAAALGDTAAPDEQPARLAGAEVIVAPWYLALAGGAAPVFVQAVVASPARKLIVEEPVAGWTLVGAAPVTPVAYVPVVVRLLREALPVSAPTAGQPPAVRHAAAPA